MCPSFLINTSIKVLKVVICFQMHITYEMKDCVGIWELRTTSHQCEEGKGAVYREPRPQSSIWSWQVLAVTQVNPLPWLVL
jgi:hypothetical protein